MLDYDYASVLSVKCTLAKSNITMDHFEIGIW